MTLLITGGIICLVSFLFALFSMGFGARKILNGGDGFGGLFIRHLFAMGGLAVGAVLLVIGLIQVIAEFLKTV